MNTEKPKSPSIRDRVLSVLAEQKMEPCLERELKGHEARVSPLPQGLSWRIRERLEAERKPLYTHQAAALEHIIAGRSVCLATPTGSDKSRVFELAALQVILSCENQDATVLVLHPPEALLPEQCELWNQQLAPYGLEVGQMSIDAPVEHRPAQLERNILLATPEVVQSWLLAEAKWTANWLSRLTLVVIDEAQELEGVFGTNVALMLRRLKAVSGVSQFLSASGALGEIQAFASELIGAPCEVVEACEDGSPLRDRMIFGVETSKPPLPLEPTSTSAPSDGSLSEQATLLSSLARAGLRFIAYVDTRQRQENATRDELQAAVDLFMREVQRAEGVTEEEPSRILPYRAGCEAEDLKRIAEALSASRLSGVVVTSHLELGVDIPETQVVVLLGLPPFVRSFRQRIDRVGRRTDGAVIALGNIQEVASRLEHLLKGSPEPHRLMLSSRPLLFFHAFCASRESAKFDRWRDSAFEDLPKAFFELLTSSKIPQPLERKPWGQGSSGLEIRPVKWNR
jgi:DEAD/DEAH box helicase domain-containing protein